MRRKKSAALRLVALVSLVVLSVPLRAIVPIDSGTLSVVLPVTINAGSGDDYDPHVDGDVASYTSDPDGIRYYDFVTGLDAQVPHTANSVNQLSDVSKGKIVFSHEEVSLGSGWSDALEGNHAGEVQPRRLPGTRHLRARQPKVITDFLQRDRADHGHR